MTDCPHSDVEVRKKTDRTGRIMLAKQCLQCGQPQSTYLSRNGIDLNAIKPWDVDLQNDYWKKRSAESAARWQAEKDEKDRAWWARYHAYVNVNNPKWVAKRNAVFARDNYVCTAKMERCTGTADHAHHLTYKNLENEPLFELATVCRRCHEQIHGREIG